MLSGRTQKSRAQILNILDRWEQRAAQGYKMEVQYVTNDTSENASIVDVKVFQKATVPEHLRWRTHLTLKPLYILVEHSIDPQEESWDAYPEENPDPAVELFFLTRLTLPEPADEYAYNVYNVFY